MAAPTQPRRAYGDHRGPEWNQSNVEQLAALVAERVAELLRDRDDAPLLDAAEVARRLGRSREFVYSHAAELGAVRLGDGPRPRLGFEPAKVAAYLRACESSRRTEQPANGAGKRERRRRRPPTNGQGDDYLPIRGEAPPR